MLDDLRALGDERFAGSGEMAVTTLLEHPSDKGCQQALRYHVARIRDRHAALTAAWQHDQMG